MSNNPTPKKELPICDYEGSTYRTDFWEGQGRDYEDAVERRALRALLPSSGGRLIDIGAGFGRLASLYEGFQQVVLVDYSQSQLAYARQQFGDERFIYVVGDVYRLPLVDHSCDVAVMVRVLHHIVDVMRLFHQVYRVLRPGGTFILEAANKRHLKNIARYLLRRGPNPFDLEPYEFAPLHFDFHPRWVADRLREAGFQVRKRRSVSLFRHPRLKSVLPISLLIWLDGALQTITAPVTPAPSVFFQATIDQGGMTGDPVPLEQLFRCPDCGHSPLQRELDAMRCSACGRRWPIENGLYIFK